MDKRSKNILYLFGFFILLIIVAEVTRPIPPNWDPSFIAEDKVPYGGYVLYEELPGLFENTTVHKINENPFLFLTEADTIENAVYFFANQYLSFDDEEYKALMEFTERGNTLFLAANHFGRVLPDSLKFTTQTNYSAIEKEIHSGFYSPTFNNSESIFKRGIMRTYFDEIDTLKTTALGYYKNNPEDTEEHINFISLQQGAGTIYLHALPEAFTNYYILGNNDGYAAAALSYHNSENFYWDNYKKQGRRVIDSPMSFVLNEISLRWAYYILIFGLILFVVFKGKREQRIIPVVEPFENSSVEFTRTIGGLYFQHRDYSNIIAKKITYFLEKVRTQYYLNTGELNADFIHKLAVKSSNSEEETQKLIHFIKALKGKISHTENDLIELNKLIEKFDN